MALTVGTRLGAYEILALIGAGGMGEVYRARDTKLNRDVALKVLPEAFTHDADRLARFKREAQVLASLNHPNIAAIYGLEEGNGSQFLVLELVEGETLAQRLTAGPLPLKEALTIARQVAEACQAAHDKGIVHRDLKPANIALATDEQVKVLDFGLAKALAPEGDSATTDANSPTLSLAATRAGVILGTAAYMSPEQAKGRAADKRSDVWAFGAVLYEMLTGKGPFNAEDLSTTLAAVIMKDPDWTALPSSVPPAIRTLVQRCLEKDRRQRIADISVVLFLLSDPTMGGTASASATPPAAAVEAPAWQRAAPWAIAAMLFAGLGALSFVRFRESLTAAPPEMRTEIVTPATTDPISLALSPDGRQLVFVASSDGPSRLWLRELSGTTTQPLPGTEGAAAPFWSPDSRSVGFFSDGQLKRLDIGGGAPRILAKGAVNRGGTWNADGVILFLRSTASPVFRVSTSGSESVAVTKLDRQTSHRWPQFLPDGRHFLFYAQGTTADTAGIYLGSLDSEDTIRLTAADTGGVYTPSGWLLWIRAGALVAQRLDVERRVLAGDPVTVADTVGFDGATNAGAFSVSATGLVAFRPGGATRRQLQWFDRAGKGLGTLGTPDEGTLSTPRVSPDGHQAVVSRTVQGNTDVWLLDGTRTSRFTFDAALDHFPIWSPDGRQIVFASSRKGARDLYVGPADSPGGEALLLETTRQDKFPSHWSTDSRLLTYSVNDPQTDWDVWVLPLDGDRKPGRPWPFLKTTFAERAAQFSPDGRWMAYASNQSGRFETYVRPFVVPSESTPTGRPPENGGTQWQVSTAGGIMPRWRPDGKELYFLGPNGQMMATPITVKGTAIEPGTPLTLFQSRVYGGGTENNIGRQYDVAQDGRFLINTVLEDVASPITILQNWKPPAK